MKRPAAAPYTKEIATMIAVVVSNKEATSRSERGAMGLGVDDLEVEVDDLEVVEEDVVRLLVVVDIFVYLLFRLRFLALHVQPAEVSPKTKLIFSQNFD